MRKSIFLGAGVFVVVLFLLGVLIGTPTSATQVDVVNGIEPVSREFANIDELLGELAKKTPEERSSYITQKCPHLDERVSYYLRTTNQISPKEEIEKINFSFGSLEGVVAQDKAGVKHNGYFKDQILANVYIKGQKDPKYFAVKCLNGLIEVPNTYKNLPVLAYGQPRQKFVIGAGKGLTSYVDYPLAITLAEKFELPVYKGKLMSDENRISYDEARRLEKDTDRVAITVYVVEGDEFNLIDMKFVKSPKRKNS